MSLCKHPIQLHGTRLRLRQSYPAHTPDSPHPGVRAAHPRKQIIRREHLETTSTTAYFMSMKKATGFTLVELMVAIAILALLTTIAVPSFNQMIASNRLTTQTNGLIAAMNIARSEAIKLNRTVSLCRIAEPDDDDCAGNGTWTNWAVLQGDRIILRGAIDSFNGTLIATSHTGNNALTGARLEFSPDGLVRTGGNITNGTNGPQIRLCSTALDSSNVRRISIGPGSRISTEKETGSCA